MASRRIIQNLVAVGAFATLFLIVDFGELQTALSNLTPVLVVVLLVLSFILIWLSALKWGLFISYLGERVSTARLFSLYLLGYFVNLLFPSYVGGDAARSFLVGKKIGQHEALAATILERYTGLVAMIFLALVFVWQVSFVTLKIRLAVIGLAASVVVATVISRSPSLITLISKVPLLGFVSQHLKKVQEALILAGKGRALLIKALLLSLVFHSVTVINTAVCAYAVGWYDPPMRELFVVLPLILLIGAIPLAPNGLGLQEGAFYFFLHGIGATPAQALGIALILRAKSYVLALFGGLVWLSVKDSAKITPAPNL